MDTYKELSSDIAKNVLARVRNPLISSFIISWLVFNWQVVIHILSLSEPAIKRVAAITVFVSQPEAHLYPLIFAVGYIAFSPWISLSVKWYYEIAEDRATRRERNRRERDLEYQRELAEREAKLLHAQRQKLQSSKDINRVREQMNTLFEEMAQEMESRFQSAADRLRGVADTIDGDTLPSLHRRLNETRDQARQMQTSMNSSLQLFYKNALRLRHALETPMEYDPLLDPDLTRGLDSFAEEKIATPNPEQQSITSRAVIERATPKQLHDAGLEEREIPAYLRRAPSSPSADPSESPKSKL